ncbi:hypothetical protein BCR36DRAFT_355240 [Piromyces finnis]|uniref:CATSPERG C-terminal domain-containing protein n=1 Tax=Piromyces finnis TaxID=1754191 RepID=A0A1Y1V5J2_9FUNG|nr:hypothetical protein BCR36DRAFT_355240 [Piromyces finnis]|eukprot:ORX47838.1 hypothetical protein BCR36DRAFT_355240 [Piromyces finnis]
MKVTKLKHKLYIYVIILISVCFCLKSSYKWEGDIINYRQDIENIKQNEESLKYAELSDSKIYYLRIRIINKSTGKICKLCNKQLMRAGGKPNVVNNLKKPDTLNGLMTFGNVIRGKYEWYYPFITNEIGIDFLIIESNDLLPYDLVREGVESHYLALVVYWDIYKTLRLVQKYDISNSVIQLKDLDVLHVDDIEFFINHSYSPFAFGILKNYKTPTALILSLNRKTLEVVEFENESLTQATEGKLNDYKLLSGIFDSTKIILNTTNGLLIGNWKEKNNNSTLANNSDISDISWVKANIKDIKKVEFDTQEPHLDKDYCNVTFIFDKNQRIYVLYGEFIEPEELLDNKKKPLYLFLNIPREKIDLISGTLSKEFCNRYLFLIFNYINNAYEIYDYDLISFEWSFVFRLNSINTNKELPYVVINDDLSGNFKLKLSGMTFQHTTSNELYLYGNALIVSSNGGYSFSCIDIFNEKEDGIIDKFKTNDGSYSFSTTMNDVWFGNINYGRSVKILSRKDSEYKNYSHYSVSPIYIENSKLKIIEIFYNSTINFKIKDIDIHNELNKYALKNELICPYKYISVNSTKEPEVVRVILENKHSQLPHHIYLEKHQFYNFTLSVYLEDNYNIENSNLMFSLNNFNNIQLNVNKITDRINRKINYDVSIYDKGNLNSQYEPGKNLELSNLITTFNGLNYKCLIKDDSNSYSTDIEKDLPNLVIYSGCSPFQNISTVFGQQYFNNCPHKNNIPCVFFEDTIDPIFQITDLVTNYTTNFTGFYTIEAIAGGTKLDNIKDFSYNTKRIVNPRSNAKNLKLIWSPSDAYDNPSMMSLERNQISFICAKGSPCKKVFPTKFFGSTIYYIKFRMSTNQVNQYNSYCKFDIDFIIQLYGIPLDFTTSTYILVIGLGIFILFTIILGLYMVHQQFKSLRVSDSYSLTEKFKGD